MKRLLVLLPAALLVLSGCGDTCSSKPAELEAANNGSCATTLLKAGSTVTVTALLKCQTCSDTDASCIGEQVGADLQIDAQFRECDSNKNCGAPACQLPRPAVSCAVPVPAVSGTSTIKLDYGTGFYSVTVASSATATSCTL